MKQIIMTLGLPGSGKSTWAKNYLREHPEAIRVNKDDLRAMLHDGKWSKDREKMVVTVRDQVIIEGVKAGKTVIVDDTNFASVHKNRLDQLARELGVPLIVVSFTHIPVEECIKNDLKRDRSVGKDVIMDMWSHYLAPKRLPPPERIDGLPEAIICDLDGTLAHMTDRGPFDEKKCGSDSCDPAVSKLVKSMADLGKIIIYVSGRKDYAIEETYDWLCKNDLPIASKCRLLMRKEDDNRKDNVVKQEIYESYIKGKYNIEFVLDDRNQVVEMWRSLGLKCLQVENGDF